jgi:glutamate--cysteine ligase
MTLKKTHPDLEAYRDYVTTLFTTNPVSDHKQSIGLELELLPIKGYDSQTPLPAEIYRKKEKGTLDLLKQTAEKTPELEFSPLEDGTPQFISVDGGNITFEPGGQIEYSSSECFKPKEAITETVKYIDIISNTLATEKIKLFHGGMNPWHTISEVGLKMQKARYLAMDQYFQELGPYGQEMMRLTLSLQINLDFADPDSGRKRWIASNLLAPIMCAIFGNSPFAHNRTTGLKSYRSFIWQTMDHCRTGFPNTERSLCADDHSVDQYLAYALDANVIKLHHDAVQHGDNERLISYRQWLNSDHPRLQPDISEWKNHINLLFPEVRPKGFIEFRTLDGPSRSWWSVPVMLLTAILYDESALNQVIKLLCAQSESLGEMLRSASEKGVSAFPELAKKVFRFGLDSEYTHFTSELRDHCERFYTNLTDRGRNPADDLLDANDGKLLTPGQFQDHDQRSRDILAPPDYTVFK